MLKENMKLYGNVNTAFRKRYLFHDDIGVDTLYSKDQSARNINRYEIVAGIANAEPTKYHFNYDFRIGVDNLSMTNTSVRENGMNAGVKLEKLFKRTQSSPLKEISIIQHSMAKGVEHHYCSAKAYIQDKIQKPDTASRSQCLV